MKYLVFCLLSSFAASAAAQEAKQPGKLRKLDITLATSAVPPKDLLGKVAPGKLELSLKVGPLAPVAALAFSPDGKLLASGCYGQVTVWDLTTGQPAKVISALPGAVNDMRFSPDGKLLAVAGGQPSAQGDLRLYQTGGWKLVRSLEGHDDVVFSVAFSPDGKKLATASFDHTVRVWNIADGKQEKSFSDHSDFVYAVAFGPGGNWLVSASKDRTVKMIEIATGKGLFTLGGMEQDVLAVAVSPDGKHVVSSGFESGLYWWDARTGERIRVQGGHSVAVNEIAFSKDGQRLVSAGSDRTFRVWDGGSGTALKTMSVGSIVYSVAISPERKRIASGSFDGLVRLWDEATGRQLLTLLSLPARNGQADWLALTPEGFVHTSSPLTKLARWRMSGQEVAGEKVWQNLQQPEAIVRSGRGETIPAPKFEKK